MISRKRFCRRAARGASSTVATAVASLRVAEEELRRLTAGFRTEEIGKAKAAAARAEAARDLAKAQLGYVEVKSPADGVVLEQPVEILIPAALENQIKMRQRDLDTALVGASLLANGASFASKLAPTERATRRHPQARATARRETM